MGLLITEISKFIICLLMLLFAAESVLLLLIEENSPRARRICTLQMIWVFSLQGLFFAQIIANTGEVYYLAYYILELSVLIAFPVVFTKLYPDRNRMLMNNMCLLLMIGMTMILRIDPAKAVRQLCIVTVSIAAGFTMIYFLRKSDVLRRFPYVFALTGIAALAVVWLLGSTTYGSNISYTLFGLTFQPSELVKLLFVLFLAGALWQKADLKHVLLSGVLAALHVLILVLSRDLGSALIFFVVYVFVIYAASGNPLYPLIFLIIGVAASLLAYRLFGHVRTRVTTFVDPWSVVDGGGYQITQSLFGIAQGLWFGMGLFNGMPGTIPFVEEDVIFSAIAEELGVIFALLMLVVCLATFLNFLREALHETDNWVRLLTIGIGVTYIFQVFLTVGGGVRFIPLTGVTLPFVSYGGSSVLSTILMFSLFEGVSVTGQKVPEEEEY